MTDLIRVSINPRLQNKSPPQRVSDYAEGFEPVDLKLHELEYFIQSGFAFSYQFHDEYRKSEYFRASDILVAEFDGGLSISECLRIPFVESFASLVYTTSSHAIDHHRFRLIFVLARTIFDANELRYATRSLVSRLGAEPKQIHPASLFLGSSDCYSKMLGGSIPEVLLDELIEDGRNEVFDASFTKSRPTANRSSLRLPPTIEIKLSDGSSQTLREVSGSAPVYCPYHRGEFPTAFVSTGRSGRFLHCRDCQKTWWMQEKGARKNKFFDFDDMVLAAKNGALLKDQALLSPLELAMNDVHVEPKNILLANDRYLDPHKLKYWEMEKGVTFVKSPKGTGKTTFLAGLVKQVTQNFSSLEDYEENDDIDAPVPYFKNDKVLLIGHRQALIGELCQRLELNCYLNDGLDIKAGELKERQKRYGVCLDSLRKVEDTKYDIIVIDEVEQVLGHFLAETIGDKRRGIFGVFARLIREARQIVLLDADLDWPSFETLNLLRNPFQGDLSNYVPEAPHTPIRIYLNQWKSKGRSLRLFDNQNHLIVEFRKALLKGERVFVTSNSKAKIEALEQVILELTKTGGIELPYFVVTSSNSKSADVQKFIKNVKSEILKYQAVLSSPSLGTGIDITFENDSAEIDHVFGFFEPLVTTHFEIDQQLARVRNPKRVSVWVSPQRFNFETEFQVVVNDILHSDFVEDIQMGFGPKNRTKLALEDPFLAMASLIVSKERASKNRLRQNFINHKRTQGWAIELIAKDAGAASIGDAVLKEGSKRSKALMAQRLLEAETLDEAKFNDLKRRIDFANEIVSQAERFCLDRTMLELFYRQRISEGLIALDERGKKRDHTLLFERFSELVADPDQRKQLLIPGKNKSLQRAKIEVLQDRSIGAALLIELLSSTPIFDGRNFDPKIEVTHCDLDQFVLASMRVRRFVEGQLGLATRKNIDKNAIQHLNSILKKIGFEMELSRKSRKTRYYRLDECKLDRMLYILDRRSSIKGWDFVCTEYGFERAQRNQDEFWYSDF